MSNTYKRPDADYNTKTSSKHANRFQEQAINKTALKGRVLDDEFNATIDSLNDLDERVTDLGVGLFPGSNDPANANNIIYCDGREAKFGKVTANLMANNSVGTDQLQFQSITNDQMGLNSISNAEIMNDAITTPKIVDNAVTEAKIDRRAVTSEKIKVGGIKADNLDIACVTSMKVQNSAIQTRHLDNQAVTNEKIATKTNVYKGINNTKLDLSSFFIPGEIKFFSATTVNNNRYVNAGWLDVAHSKSDYYNRYKAMYKADKWLEISGEVRKEGGYIIFDDILGMYPMLFTPYDPQDTNNPRAFDFEKTGLANYWNKTIGVDGNKNIPHSGGEAAIRLKEENMPAHSHQINYYSGAAARTSSGETDWLFTPKGGGGVSNTAVGNDAYPKKPGYTFATGSNTPLQWLPPTICFGGMMYMGQPAY